MYASVRPPSFFFLSNPRRKRRRRRPVIVRQSFLSSFLRSKNFLAAHRGREGRTEESFSSVFLCLRSGLSSSPLFLFRFPCRDMRVLTVEEGRGKFAQHAARDNSRRNGLKLRASGKARQIPVTVRCHRIVCLQLVESFFFPSGAGGERVRKWKWRRKLSSPPLLLLLFSLSPLSSFLPFVTDGENENEKEKMLSGGGGEERKEASGDG